MIDSEDQYMRGKAHLASLRSTLQELKNNPPSDMDNRFYELYVQTTVTEIADLEAEIAEYEARRQKGGQ